MSKETGLGDNLYLDGYDLSDPTGSLSRIHGGPRALPVTGINKSAYERLGGSRDGGIAWSSFFDKVAAHPTLSALPRTDRIATYCRGTVAGGHAACLVAKQLNYDGTRGNDGSFTFGLDTQGNGYGLEWGVQATPGRVADGSATNHASIDLGSASPGAFGLQAYLQVFAITGTSVTVKLQESSDDGGADAFADVVGGGFATVLQASAPTAQRIATAAINVERYIRVVTSGTFTVADIAVVVVRNDTAVVF